jgi:hypothetical protein
MGERHGLFHLWDQQSWIRTKPFRSGGLDGLPFSPDLVPLTKHSIFADDEERRQRILAYRLLAHLTFTRTLETEHVNPVCSALANNKVHFEVNPVQREDALHIYCDEAGHALFVDRLAKVVTSAFGLDPGVVGIPQFTLVLERIIEEHRDALDPKIIRLFFCAVSETLVSKVLFGIPQDPAVASLVREVLHDHALDERVHGAYFHGLFATMWNALSAGEREAMGHVLPELVWTFLGPDRELERSILLSFGISQQDIPDILDEVYPPGDIGQRVRQDARPTLRLFAAAGVMEEPSIADEFSAYQLLDTDTPIDGTTNPGERLIWLTPV